MKRVINFGSYTTSQRLELLESKLKKGDILLFQYCERSSGYSQKQECIDEYFENYCEDVIYYYNPDLRSEIDKNVIQELKKDVQCLGETEEKRLFHQMKAGDRTDIFEETLARIKKIVFDKLMNCNYDISKHEYVFKRMYGKSQWILDERGIVPDQDGAIWYKPANRDEYYNTLESFPLFSCIILKDGEEIDNFSAEYVVQETADNYDLLIFENDSESAV